MRKLALLLVVAALVFVPLAWARGTTTVIATSPAPAAGGSVCVTLPSGVKTFDLQCNNVEVYFRSACATSTAACLRDAGVGDVRYDFKTIANVRGKDPVRITLRTGENSVCLRNTSNPTDGGASVGDVFTCYVNEWNPF